MNADQTLRGEAHDLVLHSGLSGVTGRCTCGAWSGGGRRELPSRVAHQWDAEHLTTLPLEQIDAHGSSVEYQPAEPETASERLDAGRETAYPHEWPAGYASLAAYEQQTGEARVANQRASSWWEAAKTLNRIARAEAEVRTKVKRRADAAEAQAREDLKVVDQLAVGWRAERDAAEAKLAEAIEMVKTCTGHPDRANPAVPSHPELIQQATAQRDEAREKLAEVRALLLLGGQDARDIRRQALGLLADKPVTDREEPARTVDVRHIGRSWEDHPLEDACPCPQEPCGLVSTDTVVPECQQHPGDRAKTIRQSHLATSCPARGEEPAGEVQR